ncbi:YihY/virulence factor BrkB family protein [Baekduia soli]|uniref:YihY/virulence factor BrkB family protein n=1 Tax=Baekduia soli TaxID=496014 RepID=A0A5B8U6Q7_9ACTN|nr:YihY/virulence factor BrkB family protein [Baekduia soli]QEC48819.1 YihY/virulence factor BrkB family protein [Baekduia soli]
MDPLAPIKAFDRLQRRHRGLAIPVAVIKKFGDDQGGNLAALIAYYGFFSLFPLLMVFVAGLGFVLDGDPGAQQAVLDSALKEIPIIGDQLRAGSLTGNGLALGVGLVGALLSGLGVTLAAQTAFNRVHGVPHRERPNFLTSRLRGLGLLASLGTLQLVSTVASGLVSGGFGGAALLVAGVVVSLVLNGVLFTVAFRLLTDSSVPTRQLRPGILSATVLWTILQAVGGAYIGHVVKGAGSTYGTFATVIGLLTWLFLGARVVVYSAEVNSVLANRLWPRGLFDPPEPADDEALTILAEMETHRDDQDVSVSFRDRTAPSPGGSDGPA